MRYFTAILIPLVLLIAFLVITAFERRSGRRLFAGRRYVLDTKVSRAVFIIRHVDWGAFTSDLTRSVFERVVHDLAHASLIIVRALERSLTRIVRQLRIRRGTELPGAVGEQPGRIAGAVASIQRSARKSRKVISDRLHR